MTPMPSRTRSLDAGLRELARETFGDDRWFESPNAQLQGRSPREAVEAGDGDDVRAIIEAVLYIGVS